VIALKGREGIKVTPDFVAQTLCQDMYHAEEIIEMELEVLRTLGWHLNGPTAQDYIERFMEVLPGKITGSLIEDSEADEAAKVLLQAAVRKSEIAMLDYSLALEHPSKLALASVASQIAEIDDGTRHLLSVSTWIDHIGFIMGVASADMHGLLLQGIYGDGEDTSMGGNYVSGDDSRGE
jgi:hypothetical protein